MVWVGGYGREVLSMLFEAEDGIRGVVRWRGVGDVDKRQGEGVRR